MTQTLPTWTILQMGDLPPGQEAEGATACAFASGTPPMSGILAAVIGGVVTSIYRGSHIAINGPAAGLVAIVFATVQSLEDSTGRTMNYLMAAISHSTSYKPK